MNQERPDIPEILRTAAEFVDGIVDQVDEAERYNALCVSYLLRVAERELVTDTRQHEQQLQRLVRLTGEHGARGDLYRRLCQDIRAGRYDDRWDETFDIVMQDVIDRVKVSKPDYLDGRHRD